MRVLYVSHTAVVSGGELSLLELVGSLPDSIEPLLATPAGPLEHLAKLRGVATVRIAGTAGSLRLHPLHTPRTLLEMALAAWQVRRAVARHRAEIVHANSIRAGIVLALARQRRVPTIVHVRDCLPPGRLSTAALRLIGATATTVLANSRFTAASVLAAAPRAQVEVVYNGIDAARFDPGRVDRARARSAIDLPLGAGTVLLGVVGQLTPWKGQDTAIEALGLLCEQGLDARLVLVGSAKFVARSTRFDNESYVVRLRELASRMGVADRIAWLGERDDIPEIMSALDVLLLPSLEEPFGRALIEAMALEVPVVATDEGGPREIVHDGEEGRLVRRREPEAWARAIREIVHSADRGAMGRAGRRTVERSFTIERHVHAVFDAFSRAVSLRGAEVAKTRRPRR